MARENGTLAVRHAEDVGLEYVVRESITRIDAADAPQSLQKPRSTFYKFFTPDRKLSAIASQLKPRIIVTSHLSVLLDKTRLTTRGEFRYQVSRSGIFALTFRLPERFQVDDVSTESMERSEVTPADEAQTLTVYFTKKQLGDLSVTVVASQARNKPGGDLTLPLLEPLNATREQGLVAVIAPESLRVSQVHVPPGAEWFIDSDEAGQQLKLALKEPAVGKLDFAMTGSMVRDPNQAELVVPGVTVEQVQSQRGQLAIHLDDDLEAVLANDGGARPIDPAALDSVLRPGGNGPVHYAFRYDSPPEGLRLRLSPAPSRLNADVTTVASVREGAVAYVSRVDFDIQQAGRSRFQIATPEWLGDDLELEGEQIRQIRSQVTDDRRTWDIELQQPVRGSYR